MFEKNLKLVVLYDIYGALLSPEQQNMFDLYYNEDLSLSEIAENEGISRQGVRYTIKHAEEALLLFEEKLSLAKLFQNISDARDILTALKEKHQNESIEFDSILSLLSDDERIPKKE